MACETPQARGERMMKESGYAKGGEVKTVKRIVKRAIREHENAEHGGKHEPLKLRRGGAVEGKESEGRPDRRARGGALKGKGKGKVIVNVNAAAPAPDDSGKIQQVAQQAHQMGMQQGAQMGARAAAAKMAGGAPGGPRPPMAPPGAGAPPGPPGAPGGPPPGGMMNTGGVIKVKAHSRRRGGAV